MKTFLKIFTIISVLSITVGCMPKITTTIDFKETKSFKVSGGELNSRAELVDNEKDETLKNIKKELEAKRGTTAKEYLESTVNGETEKAEKLNEKIEEINLVLASLDGNCETSDSLTKLSNGDTVHYSCNPDELIARKYGIGFKNKDLVYTVSGLNEITEVEIFSGVSVVNRKHVNMTTKEVTYEPDVIITGITGRSDDYSVERIDDNTVRVYCKTIARRFEEQKQKVMDYDGIEKDKYYKDYQLEEK